MEEAGQVITVVLILLLVVAVNLVWAVGLYTDYRGNRYGWLLFGILLPIIGIVRGLLAIVRARRA